MKKAIALGVALLIVLATLVGCYYPYALNGGEASVNNPPETQDNLQDSLLDVTTEESSEQAGTEAVDVMAQMAGNWRWEESNPDNAFLMNLFADGIWESPGPLPTDITVGGSFDIAREESGIYYLRFIVEFQCDTPSSTVFEIGSEFADHLYYRYDAHNDRLGMALPLEGGDGVVWYIREQ